MIYIDTNILIYLLEQHERLSYKVASLLEKFTSEGNKLVTSVITVSEFLAETESSNLETLQQVPNLSIISLNENLAEQAAIIQRKNKIQVSDSIHLATAIHQHAESFFTNDKQLSKVIVKYLKVVTL